MELVHLAVPFSYILVGFISYASQYLFYKIEPGPLTLKQSAFFNFGTWAVFICYARCVLTDPGRVVKSYDDATDGHEDKATRRRWCKKCDAYKPPRAHHCKACKRCILKMDHHCPWTINCVGHRTIPHFARFLAWGAITMTYLNTLYFDRISIIWQDRNRAYYLGPTQGQFALFLVVALVNNITLFFIGVLLLKTVYYMGCNMTSIEGWTMDRHESLLKRARKHGGYLSGPGGTRILLKRHEFPYDIGIFSNVAANMGSSNPLLWLSPLASSPSHESGMAFEENGFLDRGLSWPPPDPDKMPAQRKMEAKENEFTAEELNDDAYVIAFRRRQQEDLKRRRPFTPALKGPASNCGGLPGDEDDEETETIASDGKGWRNDEGEAFDDFGVDDNHDDVPLSQLLARQKAQ